jgi:pyruvate dehydrogenase E2 component (dihydrolipoamide acetyltransferase)
MPRTPVVMPKMSMTMTEGEVVEILVTVGQKVSAGDVVAVVGTDKTDMEVESDHEGEVVEISSAPGQVLEVGAPLFVLETEGEDLLAGMFGDAEPAAPAEETAAPAAIPPAASAAPNAPLAQQPADVQSVLAMPGARKLADERGVDITQVVPASPAGIIKQSDIPLAGSREERARDQIAAVVNTSTHIPQFSVTKQIKFKGSLSEDAAERFVQLARAWVGTIRSHTKFTQQFVNGSFAPANVRIAALVRSPLGYVSPAIDAAGIETDAWKQKALSLISSAKENRIAVEHLGGASTSITDLSEFGIKSANTLLFPPQSSGINIGSLKVDNHKVALEVTLVADHRIADPGDAAEALLTFEQLLREVANGNS